MGLWGRILDNHVVEVLDEGVSAIGLIHPDHIEKDNDVPGHWEELPDGVNVGWWFKNNQWISGAQYWAEWDIEHPKPPPGPPTAHIIKNVLHKIEEHKTYVHIEANVGGWGFDPDQERHEWLIEGEVRTEEKIDLVYDHKDEPYNVDIQLTAYGPGGSHTHHVDDEEIITIPAKFVPLFYQFLNGGGVAGSLPAGAPPITRPELDPDHNYKPALTGPQTEHVVNPGDHPDALTPAGSASTKTPSGVVVTASGVPLTGPDGTSATTDTKPA